MQVFYVNIGGGEPTVRKDFWELVEYATAHHVGVKFSTNGSRIDARAARRGCAANDYVDVQISLDGATAEVNDARPRRRVVRRPRCGRWSTCAGPASSCRSSSRARTPGSSTRSRRSPTATARSCGSRGCVRPAAAPTSGTSCTRRPTQQRDGLRVAARARRDGADRRLVLPPRRVRAVAAGAEPVRRGPGRLPDRPGRRRLRLPVRDPRRRSWPATCATGGFAHVWRESDAVPRAARAAVGAARARAAGCTTRAAAAAWRRSSSPACRSTGPDPECVLGPRRAALRGRDARAVVGRPLDHGREGRHVDASARVARAGSSPSPRRSGGRAASCRGRCTRRVAGRRRARADALATTSRRSRELGFAPHVAGAAGRARRWPRRSWASTSRCRCCSRPPACRPCIRTARSPSPGRPRRGARRWALSRFASQGDRGGRRRQPEDVRPAVLGGPAGGDRGAGRAGAGGGRARG